MSLGFELVFFDLAVHPLAVCNEGTPGAYYLKRGNASRWVIHQQGGGWWVLGRLQLRRAPYFDAPPAHEHRHLLSTGTLHNRTEHCEFNGEPFRR